MKLKEFLLEEKGGRVQHFTTDYEDGNYDEIVSYIKNDCSKILDVYKNSHKFLWRGEASAKDRSPFEATIRTDRRPVEMNLQFHNEFNAAIERNGLIAHRGNSIFCTTDIDIAIGWGELCMIFPKNGFKYTWFTSHEHSYGHYVFDSINNAMDDIDEMTNRFKEAIVAGGGRKNVEGVLDKINTWKVGLIARKLRKAVKNYGVEDSGKAMVSPDEFRNSLMDEFVSVELGATSKGIEQFLKTDSEILIAGPGYYGVPLRPFMSGSWAGGWPSQHPVLKAIFDQ